MAGWGGVGQRAAGQDRAGRARRSVTGGAANRRGEAGHGGAQRGGGAWRGAAKGGGARRGAAGRGEAAAQLERPLQNTPRSARSRYLERTLERNRSAPSRASPLTKTFNAGKKRRILEKTRRSSDADESTQTSSPPRGKRQAGGKRT